ncbi:MAG TPA: hypothetical protein DCM32_05495 [Xanthomonadaceae bacterium]|jgi:hypothetical protein|nr:hypothetical protein [Xanthomonadaceae bacterium]
MPLRPLLFLLPALGLAAPPAASAPMRWSAPEIAGVMTDARLQETSGIAASHVRPGAFWVHNDSGNAAVLHLMSASGVRLASVKVAGVRNIDWEDMAAFNRDGRRYLLIADTGDNGGIRRTLRLIVVEEPATITDGMVLQPAWTLRFRWPDGARDCEAVAVDAAAGDVLLVSKKRVPPELFRIVLRPPGDEVQVAQLIGHLHGIEQPTADERQRNPVYGRYRAQVSAADLSPDGRTLAVLNYQAVYLYHREAGARWPAALRRAQRLDFAWMPQAEAVAFSLDGHEVWVAGEQRPSPLVRFRRP